MKPKRHYRHTNPVVAQMIRELYLSRRMKQAELAAFFKLSQGSISRIVSEQVWSTR
jgi:hypothetical protein